MPRPTDPIHFDHPSCSEAPEVTEKNLAAFLCHLPTKLQKDAANLFFNEDMDALGQNLDIFVRHLDLVSCAEVIISVTSETFRRTLFTSNSPHHVSVLLELVESARNVDFLRFLLDALTELQGKDFE